MDTAEEKNQFIEFIELKISLSIIKNVNIEKTF